MTAPTGTGDGAMAHRCAPLQRDDGRPVTAPTGEEG